MKIIADKRKSGKTVRIVVESSVKNIPILVPNRCMGKLVLDTAKWLDLKIPEPITINDITNPVFRPVLANGILIDEAQMIMQQILGVIIHTMTLTNQK